mmetsp:Transcript_14338/g.24413  ORF Transcript_14338/g.24413 Transcript_14338/m.24413 type:complete len:327 (-) Transcript_14338:1052-2032(-)
MITWGDDSVEKNFGIRGFIKFTIPRVWIGGFYKKFLVIFNLLLIFANKGANVLVPICLKFAVDAITCSDGVSQCPTNQETYLLIGLYALCKFAADFLNYIRELPYARLAATAEISIAHDVYDHVQRQSLAFHLSRETGKIIRIVSKGASSFSQVLRLGTFTLIPIVTEITLTLVIYLTLFSWKFCLLLFASIFIYVSTTYYLTERRAASFKDMTLADQNYNQKATDSLLNFETVKYFNAERHEEKRFEKALVEYKQQNIRVSRGLVMLNITQSFVIALGLLSTLLLANKFLETGELTVGTFIMFNSYNMQVYQPLGFLGTLWRWIR